MATPFLPTMTFQKFDAFFNRFFEKKYAVFSAVTGSGNTTLVDRLSLMIATKPENRLLILCAPQFDITYNKKYIGEVDLNGRLRKGELLQFWDKCRQKPNEKFVCMIDNIDKINPETFFGPEIWQKMDEPTKLKVVFGKDTVSMPPNFYLLSITQTGVGQKVEFTNEHFRRLGGVVRLPIYADEMIMFWRARRQELEKEVARWAQTPPKPQDWQAQYDEQKIAYTQASEQLSALRDTAHLKKLLYFFIKANGLIEEKYSFGHQIGQWSDVRKYFTQKEFEQFQNAFIFHVNAFRPQKELKKADFADIFYTIKYGGEIKNSNWLWTTGAHLADLGFASELGVAGIFALISAAFGWFYFRKRQTYIKDFTQRVYVLMEQFDTRELNYDQISNTLHKIKIDFDELVLTQKVDYNEAAFFYSFLEDKTRTIQISREINESFLKLMDAFLEDGVLSDLEYNKLNQFLESIRHRLPTPQYLVYKEEIDRVHQRFGEKV